jgi:hypothetical protein
VILENDWPSAPSGKLTWALYNKYFPITEIYKLKKIKKPKVPTTKLNKSINFSN